MVDYEAGWLQQIVHSYNNKVADDSGEKLEFKYITSAKCSTGAVKGLLCCEKISFKNTPASLQLVASITLL